MVDFQPAQAVAAVLAAAGACSLAALVWLRRRRGLEARRLSQARQDVAGILEDASRLIAELEDLARRIDRRVDDRIGRLQELKADLRVCGILLTMQDRRTIHHREVIAMVREGFGKQVFETVIPQTIRLQDAAITHKPITEYDPGSEAAEAYRAVAGEVLKRGQKE